MVGLNLRRAKVGSPRFSLSSNPQNKQRPYRVPKGKGVSLIMERTQLNELREIISNLGGECGCFDTHEVIDEYVKRNPDENRSTRDLNWIGSFMARYQTELKIKQGKTRCSMNISGSESECTCWKKC